MTRPGPAPALCVTWTAPAPATICRVVEHAQERIEHRRIRREVFVIEQAVFPTSDLDAHDARADVLHVVAWVDDVAAGTVRLYPRDGAAATGEWQGDRLAVLPAYRSAGVGAPLVRFAMAAAAARGGTRMIAHVQLPHRRFFEHLGWTAGAAELYAGLPHLAMDVRLDAV